MNLIHFALPTLLTAIATTLPNTSHAQSSERFGEYEVHYNALSTESLGAEMARKYGITRSNRNGMVNIAVQKIGDVEADMAVPAKVSGTATNLTGQKSDIVFREIAGQHVSYIGQFAVKGPDTYTFNLSILPAGATRPLTLRFNQNFAGD
jgi:hypothetical protein